MLEPKRTKYRKSFRPSMAGVARRGSELTIGEFALKAITRAKVNGKQIESARKAIVREMKRKGKLWIRVFPHVPHTKKPLEVGMGKGKGDVECYVSPVVPGKILFEISGVDESTAKIALTKAAQKLPVLTKIIVKE